MKYVAYIDILGFKEKVKNSTQEQAGALVTEFSELVYNEWGGYNDPKKMVSQLWGHGKKGEYSK